MPPSYSMMLPGRMSTPLIFMSSLGESGKEPPQPLAGAPVSGKQRVGIDRRPMPPALTGSHGVDREMEVRAGRTRVAGMPDLSNYLAALQLLPFVQPRRVGREVRIIIDPLLVGRALVDGDPAAQAVEQFFHRSVAGCDH